MPRYIDGDALIDVLAKEIQSEETTAEDSLITHLEQNSIQHGLELAIEAVHKAPTADAVPVVRCNECQYWNTPTYAEQEDGSTVGHCTATLNGQQTDAYWFCADGTR